MKTTLEKEALPIPSQGSTLSSSSRVQAKGVVSPNGKLPIRIKTVLVPLDFSSASMQAVSYAVALAKQFNGTIHLVYVQAPDEACAVAGAGHLMRETAESVTFLRDRLSEVHRKHGSSFWPENCHVRTGQAYQEICNLAREIDADAIVIASRGHTGLKRVLLGSTAERVVRFAPCPVLVVRQRKRGGRMGLGFVASSKELTIRKILVPVDFSECAMAGAMYAALLAKTFGAKLVLVHAVFPPAPVIVDRVSVSISPKDRADRANAQFNMEAFTQLDFLRDIKCETEIRTGYAKDEICSAVGRRGIDLIVTSSHGRTGFNRMLLGSVAEHVMRYAQCPVMIVPSGFRPRVGD